MASCASESPGDSQAAKKTLQPFDKDGNILRAYFRSSLTQTPVMREETRKFSYFFPTWRCCGTAFSRGEEKVNRAEW